MSCHASTVDDPEKHFLGNLLEEDTSHNSSALNGGTSSSLGTIPPVSVISGVGPISTNSVFRSYWPEPPPPYSPPIQSSFQTPWYSSEPQFLKPTPSDFFFTSGQPTFIAQPQIHHHHHNLHHHTHTHNVVENHHHYPVATVTLPSQNHPVNSVSGQSLNFTSIVQNTVEGTQRESARKCVITRSDTREQAVQAAAVVVTKKPPLSYRDVAARTDQISGSDGGPLIQAKKLQSHSEGEHRSCYTKPRQATTTESTKVDRNKGELKIKCIQPVEFQKITRKKTASKKEKNELVESSSLPVVSQRTSVEAPTKYEVLQKLVTKASKKSSNGEDVIRSKREREPVRAAMISDRSRSSSLFTGNNDGTVIDVAARPKRGSEPVDKKKTSGIVNSGNQPQVRRRVLRKRNEPWCMDKTVAIIALFSCWIELGFKWILNLVVDVCLQIYDVTAFSIAYFWESVQCSSRKVLLMINSVALSCASSIRQIDIRRMMRFRESEPIMWGLEENITLPTTGEEALERFLYSPRCQDAYGVLGLRASCSEEDVRRHYKRLSALLNPVKHHELGEMWDRICERIEEARNSMFCDCGRRHARIALDIRQSEARYCRRCRIRHPARANDIWVETRLCGLLWVYFTCCDGIVYDITDWATCEVNYLKHVRPNSHTVQYRLISPSSSSSGKSSSGDSSSHHHNDKMRELMDAADELRPEWGRSGHAQVSYLPLEPRDEDRSRRAANRRQKKWR